MNDDSKKLESLSRRDVLTNASLVGGAVGAVTAATPFVVSWEPSRKARGEGAPVEVDISALVEGELLVVPWRRKPVWVLSRSSAMMSEMSNLSASDLQDPDSNSSVQPEYCKNENRSIKPELFICLGVCTHLGCSPGVNNPEGFLCACHGSKFDYAGRVFAGSPAPSNLEIPNHYFIDDKTILVGESQPT